jgi:predicted transcriptional regulator of viral defense system
MASTIHVSPNPALRVSAEFLEMPGLKLTLLQASRLFGLSRNECQALFSQLVAQGFLIRTTEGQYIRPSMRRSRM